LIKIALKLDKEVVGEVPKFQDMQPMVLYRSLNPKHIFAEMMYKTKDKDPRLVAIQVTRLKNGLKSKAWGATSKTHGGNEKGGTGKNRRKVDKFLDKLGCDMKQLDVVLIPSPDDADVARFDDALKPYDVWKVPQKYIAKDYDDESEF